MNARQIKTLGAYGSEPEKKTLENVQNPARCKQTEDDQDPAEGGWRDGGYNAISG